ncbi:MAG: alkaline phosphatase D family protein [Betaproteobacteria bacterium]
MVQFNYGVASGDPLSNKVILWTHAKYEGFNESVALAYEVATDAAFTNVVSRGTTTATEATSFTAKVDAEGLSPATDYYYRFKNGVWISPIGRTRTLPTGSVAEVKLAVFSCSSFAHGYFHVYGEASNSDAQYAVHLGDYIYEYKDGEYPTTPVGGRNVVPANEILTLADYRTRHALYKSDVNLKRLHSRMPLIAVWDDHEFANDAYMTGAENHTEGVEGAFAARKAAALQAYHEWMPIRTGADKSVIYRSFDFGNLLSLHMLDTRLIGREKQLDQTAVLTTAAGQTAWQSTTRQLMGTTQTSWLQTAMTASSAKWQVLGQQVVMAATWLPLSVQMKFQAYFGAPNATTAGAIVTEVDTYKAALRSANPAAYLTASNPVVPYNFDAWDGYPAARETVLQMFSTIATNQPTIGKKLVVLSGDSHNAWHTNLTLISGTKVGEEFATSSVTSPGWESYFPSLIPTIKSLFEDTTSKSNVQWMDAARRGYLKMTFTAAQAKGEFIFIDSVSNTTYTVQTPVVAETRTYAG